MLSRAKLSCSSSGFGGGRVRSLVLRKEIVEWEDELVTGVADLRGEYKIGVTGGMVIWLGSGTEGGKKTGSCFDGERRSGWTNMGG